MDLGLPQRLGFGGFAIGLGLEGFRTANDILINPPFWSCNGKACRFPIQIGGGGFFGLGLFSLGLGFLVEERLFSITFKPEFSRLTRLSDWDGSRNWPRLRTFRFSNHLLGWTTYSSGSVSQICHKNSVYGSCLTNKRV